MNALYMGRPTLAEPLAKKLVDIDPLTPINYFAAGMVPLMEKRFDLVFEFWSRWYELGPDSPISALWYAWPLVWNNKVGEAIEFRFDPLRSDPRFYNLLPRMKFPE